MTLLQRLIRWTLLFQNWSLLLIRHLAREWAAPIFEELKNLFVGSSTKASAPSCLISRLDHYDLRNNSHISSAHHRKIRYSERFLNRIIHYFTFAGTFNTTSLPLYAERVYSPTTSAFLWQMLNWTAMYSTHPGHILSIIFTLEVYVYYALIFLANFRFSLMFTLFPIFKVTILLIKNWSFLRYRRMINPFYAI